MLVQDYMTRHPIMIPPEMGAAEAQRMLTDNQIRHLPVVGSGKRLQGLITTQRLWLKPDTLGSLNVWEITRYLADLKVEQVMLPHAEIHTIEPHETIETAARCMAENKIGCLPVIEEDDVVVGMLTEIDLLRSLQDMLAYSVKGVRVTMRMPDKEGEFAKLTGAIAAKGWGVMGIGSFPTPRRPGFYDVVLKMRNVSKDQARATLTEVPGQELIDIRASS